MGSRTVFSSFLVRLWWDAFWTYHFASCRWWYIGNPDISDSDNLRSEILKNWKFKNRHHTFRTTFPSTPGGHPSLFARSQPVFTAYMPQSSAIMMQYKLPRTDTVGKCRIRTKTPSVLLYTSLVCFERQNLVPFLVLTTGCRRRSWSARVQFWRELARFVNLSVGLVDFLVSVCLCIFRTTLLSNLKKRFGNCI